MQLTIEEHSFCYLLPYTISKLFSHWLASRRVSSYCQCLAADEAPVLENSLQKNDEFGIDSKMRFVCHVYLLTKMATRTFLWILLVTVIETKQYFETNSIK